MVVSFPPEECQQIATAPDVPTNGAGDGQGQSCGSAATKSWCEKLRCNVHVTHGPFSPWCTGIESGSSSEGPLVPGPSCFHSQEQVWLFDY